MSEVEATLREVVEALAPLERGAGSPGERQAAQWLADRLRRAGARHVRVEDTPFRDGYATLLAPLDAAAFVAGVHALRRGGRSLPAAVVGLTAALLIADDASNGLRPWRRLVGRRRTTTNIVAECGAQGSDRTLVVLAHHDAAPTGVVFDQRPQRWLARRFPDFVERSDSSFPLWWPVVAAPLAVGLGALTGRRGLTLGGTGGVLAGLALAVDIARGRVVPGANDNLSACAALVALAEADDLPLRVVLASCGAEEVLQGGIYGFVEDHLRAMPRDRTWVLNLDTIGSPELIMLEGEGTFVMEDYCDPSFRDAVAKAAATASGEPLRRGCRARSSTDSVIPSRAGYPTTTLCSWEPDTKCLSNYHLPTDTPDRLLYGPIERAVRTAAQLAHDLA